MVISGGGDHEATAKLFMDGDDQAVLLPEAFWLPGDEVMVSWNGDKVVLEPLPAERPPLDSKAFWAKIDACGGGGDLFPDGPPDDPPLAPDPRKFFDT